MYIWLLSIGNQSECGEPISAYATAKLAEEAVKATKLIIASSTINANSTMTRWTFNGGWIQVDKMLVETEVKINKSVDLKEFL